MAGRLNLTASILSVFVFSAGATMAQSVISARAGMVHYIEGDVTIDDKAIEMKNSQFPEIKEQQVLKTGEGRAEVLLTPGVFLRLAENSSFRLLSSRLTDTRVEALGGTVLLEHGEVTKDTQVTLIFKDRSITFAKSGLYRLDAEKGNFRVYQGEAHITAGTQSFTAKQAREVELLAPVLMANKFDNKVGDEFYRWASRRASYLALANISAAKSMRDSGMRLTSGMWHWSPYFGMFTYVPYGYYFSPFGYSFWSPSRVMQLYQPSYGGGGYGGYAGGGGGGRYDAASGYNVGSRGSSMGMSGGGYSSGSVSNASSGMSSAPASSGGGDRGSSGGGAVSGSTGSAGGRGR